MYIAISIMLCGIIAGRLTRRWRWPDKIQYLNLPALLVLLFFMGIGIGKNRAIVDSLPILGANALLLTICGMGGSLFCVRILRPFLDKYRNKKNNE